MYYEFVVFSLFGFVIFFCLISHSSTMCFEGSTDVSYVELIYPDYKTVNTFNSTGLGCIPKSIVKAWNTASILFASKMSTQMSTSLLYILSNLIQDSFQLYPKSFFFSITNSISLPVSWKILVWPNSDPWSSFYSKFLLFFF